MIPFLLQVIAKCALLSIDKLIDKVYNTHIDQTITGLKMTTTLPFLAAAITAYEKRVAQLKKDGYEVVESYRDDESDEEPSYYWKTYSLQGITFYSEEEAWDDAEADRAIMYNEE